MPIDGTGDLGVLGFVRLFIRRFQVILERVIGGSGVLPIGPENRVLSDVLSEVVRGSGC